MENTTSFGKISLINGLLLALILLVPTVVFYVFDLSFFNFLNIGLLLLVSIVVLVFFMINGIKEYRDKLLEGKINYGKKFLMALVIGLIGSIVSSILGYAFFELVDPTFIADQAEEFILKMEEFMDESQLADLKEQMDAGASGFDRMLDSFKQGSIGAVVISLIVAAIVKSDTTEQNDVM